MKNHEISRILRSANNMTSYLWDKPRPQWKEKDWLMLKSISEGRSFEEVLREQDEILREQDEKKQAAYDERYNRVRARKLNGYKGTGCHRKHSKRIMRVSDGKIYETMQQCADDNGIQRPNLSWHVAKAKVKKYLLLD